VPKQFPAVSLTEDELDDSAIPMKGNKTVVRAIATWSRRLRKGELDLRDEAHELGASSHSRRVTVYPC
jgi:hypothetical protein